MAKATPSSIKVHSIGTVKGLIGSATATDTAGIVRTLHIGDKVYENEIIHTSAASTVQIEFANAKFATIGHDSSLALEKTVFDPNAKAAHTAEDVAKIQAKIAAGADPTDVTDAAAAGSAAAGGDDGHHSAVFVHQNATSGLVTAGFESAMAIAHPISQTNETINTLYTIAPNVNDNPVILSDSNVAANTVAENAAIGATVGVTALGTDADIGTTVTYSLTNTAGGHFAINATTGVVTVAAALNYETATSHTITVLATSSDGSTQSDNFTIAVTNVNDAPIANPSALIIGTEDTAMVLTWANFGITDVDSANSSLGIKITALPADGVLQVSADGLIWTNITSADVTAGTLINYNTINTGHLRFMPDANESGADAYNSSGTGNLHNDYAQFQFQPFDGSATGNAATMHLDITPVVDLVTLIKDSSTTGSTPGGNTVVPTFGAGFTSEFFDNIAGLGSNASGTAPNTIEPVIAGSTAGVVSTITNVGTNVITYAGTDKGVVVAVDDAYEISGLIFLQAGSSYVFSGYIDDSFRLKIGGTTVVDGYWGGGGQGTSGTFTANAYTPTASGYYSIDIFVYNTTGAGSYDVNLAVNGGAVQNLSTANFILLPNAAALEAANLQHGLFVPNTTTGDGGYYSSSLNAGMENTAIKLSSLTATFGDTTDNSEIHVITISGIPVGAVLSDGTHSFTATAGNTSAQIWNEDSPGSAVGGSNWDMTHLTVTPPLNYDGSFTLTATATATEMANGVPVSGQTTSTTTTWTVTVQDSSEVSATNDSVTMGEGYWQIDTSGSTTIAVNRWLEPNDGDDDDGDGTVGGDGDYPSHVGVNLVADSDHPITAITIRAFVDEADDPIQVSIIGPDGTVVGTRTIAGDTEGAVTLTLTGLNLTEGGTYQIQVSSSDGDEAVRISSLTYSSTQVAPMTAWVDATASGNVISNDSPGSEGAVVSSISSSTYSGLAVGSGIDIAGNYGILHINPNGSYIYTQFETDIPTAGVSDVFTYTLLQTDGDTASATLTVNITNHVYSTNDTSGADFIGGTDGNDNLDGGSGNDIVYGGAGNDTLYGDGGNDHVIGGIGNDTLYASTGNNNTDTAVNLLEGGAGNDILYGSGGVDYLYGGADDDTLDGNNGADILDGGAGDDILDGGAGNDTMTGGTGNDTYIVDSASDIVIENANAGTDTVQSSVTYTLSANVENLTLTGSSNRDGYGNELDNVLTGNSGDNDLYGYGGNDTYYIQNASDVVHETASNGTDTVYSTVTHTLEANVENLTLTGTAAIGTGNTLDNIIEGNASANTLSGGTGNDILVGGAGADTLWGDASGGTSAGNDTFVFKATDLGTIDTISDFKVADANTLGSGGDALDISDILQVGHPTDAQGLITGGYLSFTFTSTGPNTGTIMVKIDGDGGAGPTQTLANVNVTNTSAFTNGTSSLEILNTLLNNHEIKL